MKTTKIVARDLGDAWFQTLYKILEPDAAFVYTIDRGSYAGQKRLEFDWVTIQIKQPWTLPLVPKIEPHYGVPDPCDEDYLYGRGEFTKSYIEYLMSGEVEEGESYTYGQRLTKYPISIDYIKSYLNEKNIVVSEQDIWENDKIISINKDNPDDCYLNQTELLIWTYKNKGYRNNQMVLQIAHPTDMLLQDPPCLRSIDTRIQDGALHFYPYFRSWDLFNGFPANLAAIENLKQYCAACIGVENGEIIATCKGLHVYDYAFDISKVLRMKEDIELKEGTN